MASDFIRLDKSMPRTDGDLERRRLVQRIEKRIADLDTNAAAVSRRAKIGTTGVHDILSGKNKSPSLAVIKSLSAALECTVGYLIGDDTTPRGEAITRGVAPIPVIGIAEAGAFRPMAEIWPDHEHDFPTINAERCSLYPKAKHFAFEVRGDSMNAAKPAPIVEGMHVLCVDVIDAELAVETGRIYVVRRTRDGGQTYEWTIKRAKVFRDRVELLPESTNPTHKPLLIRPGGNDGVESIEAVGWVYHAGISFVP